MPDKPTPKIQPWKAMKTMEEDLDPDFGKLKNFQSTEPTCGSGSSVSKPMDRRTGYGSWKKEAVVDTKTLQK